MSTPLSAVIVNWNGWRLLPQCLDALIPQLPPGAEIVLVDNGSTDDSVGQVRARYPAVRMLALRTNLGFAGGVNAGLRAACGDQLLLLNNDAFVEPGFVAAMVAALDSSRSVGAVSAVLLFAHRPELVASAGIRVFGDGLATDLWAGRPTTDLPTTPQQIMGASGGAALFRRAMLEDIGLMEAGFFNYLEDADLAWRALLRGWCTLVAPHARARHVYSATAGQGSPFKQRLLGRNRVRTIVRCLPGPLLRRCLPAILRYDALALGYSLLSGQPAMAAGRAAALRELPALLRERRAIQTRRSAPIDEIAGWLEPAEPPWRVLREQRRLDAILAQR